MENPIEMNDLGVPLFLETPICCVSMPCPSFCVFLRAVLCAELQVGTGLR